MYAREEKSSSASTYMKEILTMPYEKKIHMSQQKMLPGTEPVSEWDILKGIGALGLPFIHVIEIFLLCELIDSSNMLPCSVVTALTVFGPSVFMISMGMKLQKTESPSILIRYGKGLLLIGILLNALRSIIPALLVLVVVGSSADHLVSFLFLSDIYLFAGLFYLLLGLFRKARISMSGITVISLLMLTANCLFSGSAKTGSETINAMIGNIVYVDDGSVFPLLSWTVFPVSGMLAGKALKNKTQKETDRICVHALWISAIILLSTAIVLHYTGSSAVQIAVSSLNENKTGPLNIILVLCLNMIAIVLIRFLTRIIHAERINRWLGWMSANLMIFYFVHWCILTLICYAVAAVLEMNGTTAGFGLMMLLAALVDVLSVIVVKKWGFSIMKWIFKAVRL